MSDTVLANLEPELKEYQMPVSPEKGHSLLAFATMLLGDSQTMMSEAAVLGIPSLRCNSFAGRIAYLEEEEKRYGLTYAFLPEQFNQLKQKLSELLNTPNLRDEFQKRRQKLLNDKIDVSAFMLWFVENFPKSKALIKKEADFWNLFK